MTRKSFGSSWWRIPCVALLGVVATCVDDRAPTSPRGPAAAVAASGGTAITQTLLTSGSSPSNQKVYNDNWDPNASVDGNLVVDPLLVNPASSVPGSGHVAYSNDYHLLPGSPAVGYADPRYIVPTDHAGRCRAIAAAVGAYEP